MSVSLAVRDQYTKQEFPIGEEIEYKDDNTWRITNEEKRYLERQNIDDYNDARLAAEVHKQVRKNAVKQIKPGMSMIDICELIEKDIRKLVVEDGLNAGIAFPTGCSLNNVAAHYTPNKGDSRILKYDDLMKIDFGVHVNGRIIDSAFTMSFDKNGKYDGLKEAVKEATYTGIKESGIDVRLNDIGAAIQEVMESHQVEFNGKLYDVKCIRNLTGHSIDRYRIHSKKIVPIVKGIVDENIKMEEGEYYAIETFGSTGTGHVIEGNECSHYMMPIISDSQIKSNVSSLRFKTSKQLFYTIKNNFSTLAFCPRYLDRLGQTKYQFGLQNLVNYNLLKKYPPLYDPVPDCYTAHYEHTLVLKPTCKEILSKSDDY